MRSLIFVTLLASGIVIGIYAADTADFSGGWTLNEGKSTLDEMGTQFIPAQINVTQSGNDMTIEKVFKREYEDDMVFDEKLTLDGAECKSEFWNSPRVSTANWSEKGDSLTIATSITFERDGQSSEMTMKEIWSMSEGGKVLSIVHSSASEMGERNVTMVYDKAEK